MTKDQIERYGGICDKIVALRSLKVRDTVQGSSSEIPYQKHTIVLEGGIAEGKNSKLQALKRQKAAMKVTEAEEMIRARLSKVMRQKRITPSILARKTGISESVIRGYVQEGVVPTAGRLAVICEALKLDIAWVCGLRAGRRIKMSDYDISKKGEKNEKDS